MTEENKIATNGPANQATEEAQQPTSYAVRPRHHYRRLDYSDPTHLRLRNVLNMVFMLLVIVGILLWYTIESHTPAYIVLLVGVVLKIAEVCIRLFRK